MVGWEPEEGDFRLVLTPVRPASKAGVALGMGYRVREARRLTVLVEAELHQWGKEEVRALAPHLLLEVPLWAEEEPCPEDEEAQVLHVVEADQLEVEADPCLGPDNHKPNRHKNRRETK